MSTATKSLSSELAELRVRLGEIHDLERVEGMLQWDEQVCMPRGGAEMRGAARATIARVVHERATAPELGTLIDRLEHAAADWDPDGIDAGIVRVARRDFETKTAVPAALVGEIAHAASVAHDAWLRARDARDGTGDFTIFAPFLERNLELRLRQSACFPGAAHPYDPLLDAYEPDLTSAEVSAVFSRLRDGLVSLVETVTAAPEPRRPGPFDVAQQRELVLEMVRRIGFDDEHWRFDESVHPFAAAPAHTDIRITSRFRDDDLSGIFLGLHECGHGLYERQIGAELVGTTVGWGASYAIHESQSRLWENLVGRSEPFWRYWFPEVQRRFPAALEGFGLAELMRAVNRVKPTLIRIESDEVTYSLHVILRYELELALVGGDLAVGDLPAAWDARMGELLGIDVPDERRGVLQDMHWGGGWFGYFPTYAVGNMVSAQLWRALRSDLPGVDDALAAGDPGPVRAWLGEHVHRHGRTVTLPSLLQRVTGAGLDPEPYLDHLSARYAGAT
ncbi:MAG TPA: carboxypeptidase M32 [Conexibacter sp.]|nr:carboxypeptidase M32 [Conexibacter sp.]